MDQIKALEIIRQGSPGMCIEDAFRLIETLTQVARTQLQSEFHGRYEVQTSLITEATLWAYREFMAEDVQNYQIRSIKRLRENFDGLGLAEAKRIIDELKMDDEFQC